MSKKISVDLTDENAGALYQNKKVHGLGYGPTINISNRDRYYGIRYEITMYYTHIGYSILSGDGHCENIPSWFQAFLLKVVNVSTLPDPITEDDIDAIAKLETEGRRLLKQLAAANN